jgi:type VI secretion system protein ImpL
MLHDVQHFDPEALKSYLARDWDTQFGRSLTAEEREQLDTHLNALLAQGAAVSPLAEDKQLVDFHRSRLAAVPLPQRIYDRMRQQGLGKEFPEFTVVRAAGNNAALVFTRPSGQPLTRGVPGLFTYDGYHKGFQKAVSSVAQQLAEEQAGCSASPSRARTPRRRCAAASRCSTRSGASTSTSTPRAGAPSSPTSGSCR